MREEISVLRAGLAADPDQIAEEMADFPDAEFAEARDAPVWARWSPETQVRHMAYVPCRWMNWLLKEPLEERGYTLPPVDMEPMIAEGRRRVPPSVCPDRESLIAFMRPVFDFCVGVLDRETPEGLRSVTCLWRVDPEAVREDGDSREKPIDFWRMASKLHPWGVSEDPDRPGDITIELGGALRQIHWEVLAHLRTLQRFKELLDLPVRLRLPREGYLSLPRFYN